MIEPPSRITRAEKITELRKLAYPAPHPAANLMADHGDVYIARLLEMVESGRYSFDDAVFEVLIALSKARAEAVKLATEYAMRSTSPLTIPGPLDIPGIR